MNAAVRVSSGHAVTIVRSVVFNVAVASQSVSHQLSVSMKVCFRFPNGNLCVCFVECFLVSISFVTPHQNASAGAESKALCLYSIFFYCCVVILKRLF